MIEPPSVIRGSARFAILGAVAFAATRFLDDRDWESSVRDVLERLGSPVKHSGFSRLT